MKYILRTYTWPGWPSWKHTKHVVLAVGEKQFIRARRKQAYRARCIFDSDCANLTPAMKLKVRYDPPSSTYGISEKHYYSIEALLTENFEVVL